MKRIEDTRLGLMTQAKPYLTTNSLGLRSVPEPKMLIDRLLPAGGVMGLTSYPGVGKTFLAMEIARAVASGKPALGEFLVEGGAQGVLFVGSDSSEADYARQWCRLTAKEYTAWEATCDPYLPVEGNPTEPYDHIQFLVQSKFMLDNFEEVANIVKTANDNTLFPSWTEEDGILNGETVYVRRGGCRLIVLDTLSRLTQSEQNNNTAMEAVFANARLIAETTGAALIILHHNSKPTQFNDGQDFRGASSQIGALDSWLQLSAHKKKPGLIRVDFKKFRGIKPSDFEYRMNVSDPDTANLVYLGGVSDLFGSADDLKNTLIPVYTDWKTETTVVEELWASHSDQFDDRGKFKKAVANRTRELYRAQVLERRSGPRLPNTKGAVPYEYKAKSCPSPAASIPTNSSDLVVIPTTSTTS